jgi:hypothetical protein
MPRGDENHRSEEAGEPYLTGFGEASSQIFATMERLREAEQGVTGELLKRVARSELSFVCERCGALVWVENAEHDALILVEADGTPHEDRCQPASEIFNL